MYLKVRYFLNKLKLKDYTLYTDMYYSGDKMIEEVKRLGHDAVMATRADRYNLF